MNEPVDADRRISVRDLVVDAFSAVRAQAGRSMAIGVAAALGVAAVVGAVQMASAADAQVEKRIHEARPESIKLTYVGSIEDLHAQVTDPQLDRAGSLDGVRAATVVQRLGEPIPVFANQGGAEQVPLAGTSGDLVPAVQARVEGRTFTPGELRSGAHVAMVGRRVATKLSLPAVRFAPTLWIEGRSYQVIGVLDDSDLTPDLADMITIPRNTMIEDLGSQPGPFESTMYVRADRNKVPILAEQLPLWIDPAAPQAWRIEVPRTSLDLATAISDDVRVLSVASGVLVLLIGAVGIGNATLRNVYSRLHELGVRRALGARTSEIAGLLAIEAATVGAVAGLIGSTTGFAAAFALSWWQGWPLVFRPELLLLGVAMAVLAALLGAAYPARVAVRISPAVALRSD